MSTRESPWLWLTVLMVAAIGGLLTRLVGGAAMLTSAERLNIAGGANSKCAGTIYSCHDPNYTNACTLSADGQTCSQCRGTNVPYTTCLPNCVPCNCTVTIQGSSPWCGTVFAGRPSMQGQCVSADCSTQLGNCGVQIGTVTGDVCS